MTEYKISEQNLVALIIDPRLYQATTECGKKKMIKKAIDLIDKMVKHKHIERVKE